MCIHSNTCNGWNISDEQVTTKADHTQLKNGMKNRRSENTNKNKWKKKTDIKLAKVQGENKIHKTNVTYHIQTHRTTVYFTILRWTEHRLNMKLIFFLFLLLHHIRLTDCCIRLLIFFILFFCSTQKWIQKSCFFLLPKRNNNKKKSLCSSFCLKTIWIFHLGASLL